jgi:MYXO-CTERM domain-containing protein
VTVTAADAAGNVSAQADVAFVVQTPSSDDGGGGGCGCGPGGAGPEALLLVTLGLVLFRRRRTVR